MSLNEDGLRHGGDGRAGKVASNGGPEDTLMCRESWPLISHLGGRVLDKTQEGAWGDG